MRAGSAHDIKIQDLKGLKKFGKYKHKILLINRISAENDQTRIQPDSWADLNRENERKKRVAKIRELFQLSKQKLEALKAKPPTP